MTALDDIETAYRTLLLPQEPGDIIRQSLLKRGFSHYIDGDGNEHGDELLGDVEAFGLAAMQFAQMDDHDGIFTDNPGQLATVAMLSTYCIKNIPELKDHVDATDGDKVQPLHDVRNYFQHNVVHILQGRDDLLQDVAEVIYQKPAGEDGPHPGRVCTGIEFRDDLGTACFKIPIQSASPECIVRDGNGDVRNAFEDRTLFVPIDDIDHKYEQYLKRGFKKLVAAQESMMAEQTAEWLLANESRLSETITGHMKAGRNERVWADWQQGEKQIRVIKNAVKAAADDLVTIGNFHPAADLYEAIDTYEPEKDWEERWLMKFSSVRSLAQTLSSFNNHRDVATEQVTGGPNRYRLQDTDSAVEGLDAEQPEDLFQLPCFAAMEEHLHENGPVRKDLWNFTRTAWWLSRYHHDRSADTILDEDFLEDIQDTFSRWDWHDPEETEYQVRWEIEQGDIDGNIPRPRNCDHEDMQRWCIGKEVCPYSIYGSLPFPEAMYEFLDEDPGF